MIILALAFGTLLARGDEAKDIFTGFERNLHGRISASGYLVGKGADGANFKESFLLQKPKSFRVIDDIVEMYCNGKVQFNYLPDEKAYLKPDMSSGFGAGTPDALDAFLGFPTGSRAPYFVNKTEFRMQTVDGRLCAAKAFHFESYGRDDRMVFYVDKASKQILGWDQVFGDRKIYFRFENLRFDVDIPKGAFDWKPTPDLKERK